MSGRADAIHRGSPDEYLEGDGRMACAAASRPSGIAMTAGCQFIPRRRHWTLTQYSADLQRLQVRKGSCQEPQQWQLCVPLGLVDIGSLGDSTWIQTARRYTLSFAIRQSALREGSLVSSDHSPSRGRSRADTLGMLGYRDTVASISKRSKKISDSGLSWIRSP